MPESASSKRPVLRPTAPGESSLLVAEELALDQGRRQGGAIDLDQRTLAAAAQPVERPGDELLTGAGLAQDQHRGVGGRDLLDLVEHLAHRFAGTDDLLEVTLDLLLQIDVLGLQAVLERIDLRQGLAQIRLGPARASRPLAEGCRAAGR